jgi:hypothetical protein
MLGLITLAVAAGWVLLAATTAASAQMSTPTTCSEAKSACLSGCGRPIRANPARNAPVDRCLQTCNRHQSVCLRTGDWRGRVKRSGLRRA